MNVLVIQPGFPAEIPYFVRGLAQTGIRVLGVGDQPARALPPATKQALSAYLQVKSLWDAPALIDALRRWDLPLRLARVECLWEAGMELAAEVRAAFRLPGLDPDQTRLFRDKDLMRGALDRAGVRNPRHARARSEREVLALAPRVGFPLIIKPVAGAGSANTHRVDDMDELRRVLPSLRRVPEVVVEEFVRGTEYTFDTLCIDGRIVFANSELYRPDMLTARSVEEVSPQTISLRDLSGDVFQRARAMSQAVIEALGYRTGFTHMEWFHTEDDEVVFGEIAGRPPGGNSGELMNRTCDFDVYQAWGRALQGVPPGEVERRYNVAMVFKRARGRGRIRRIEGLGELERRLGPALVRHELRPVGAPRRDWRQTLLSDGFVMLRHPDLEQTLALADEVADRLVITAE
ncbi:MAG: acetyl-CoA carboxylase biotin carboxylase subunit family protein [Planctomycetota bacterium]